MQRWHDGFIGADKWMGRAVVGRAGGEGLMRGLGMIVT